MPGTCLTAQPQVGGDNKIWSSRLHSDVSRALLGEAQSQNLKGQTTALEGLRVFKQEWLLPSSAHLPAG